MDNTLFTFTAQSPEDLKKQIAALPPGQSRQRFTGSVYAAVALSDPKVCVCPFHFSDAVPKDIKRHVLFEAVQILALPAFDIVVDYQIFSSSDGNISGIFTCLPQALLLQYLKILEDAQLVPTLIVPEILADVAGFTTCGKPKERSQRCVYLNFPGSNKVHLAVINAGRCELVRQIVYEHVDDVLNEIVLSVRKVNSGRDQKPADHIYVTGRAEGDDGILTSIKNVLKTEVVAREPIDLLNGLRGSFHEIFQINLGRFYVFSRERRELLIKAVLGILLAVMVFDVVGAWKIGANAVGLNTAKSANYAGRYQYALELQKKLKAKGYAP
jgi:hypothetical protein